jgi:DNA-binding beta-propeller fold protein YncE
MSYGNRDLQYELMPAWARLPQDWSFVDVCGIAVDPEDNVYILNRGGHPVVVLDREGRFLSSWGEGFFGRAHGSCIADDGSLFCTDDFSHVVAKFSPSGELLLMMGSRGQGSDTGYVKAWDLWQGMGYIERGGPPFNRPTGVAVAPSGDIFISDGYGNSRVHRFGADGTLKLSWGEPGGLPGQFRLPHDIAINEDGHVLVADRENSRIQIFDQEGAFLEQWYDVIRPTGIFIDEDGLIYVSELAMRISIFSPEGALLARWGNRTAAKDSALFHGPHAVAVDSLGDIYVGEVSMTHAGVDKGANTIQKFRRVK